MRPFAAGVMAGTTLAFAVHRRWPLLVLAVACVAATGFYTLAGRRR